MDFLKFIKCLILLPLKINYELSSGKFIIKNIFYICYIYIYGN